MSDEGKGCLVLLVAGIVFIGAITFGDYLWSKWQCGRRAEVMGLESKYQAWNGCFLKVNEKFIPERKYRGIYELDQTGNE